MQDALDTAAEPNDAVAQALTDFLFAAGEGNDRDALFGDNSSPCSRTAASTRTRPRATCMRAIQKSEPVATRIWLTCSNGG